jgi:hypothetical protein
MQHLRQGASTTNYNTFLNSSLKIIQIVKNIDAALVVAKNLTIQEK